jgi:RNA polymerase sigma-70 factor (ECF subfamily)
VLTRVDDELLTAVLSGDSRAWQDFVDRFLPLILLIIDYQASAWSVPCSDQARTELAVELFQKFRADNFAPLRSFERRCSLAVYLTVFARRVIGAAMK